MSDLLSLIRYQEVALLIHHKLDSKARWLKRQNHCHNLKSKKESP